MPVKTVDRRISSGVWRAVHRGVYATFTGKPSREAELWAALLYCSRNANRRRVDGLDAALSHETAAFLWGFATTDSQIIHVTIPEGRRSPRQIDGIRIHLSTRFAEACHPAKSPPRIRVEETVIDLVQACGSLDRAIQWMSHACAAWRTTATRPAKALATRQASKWRAELRYALDDIDEGATNLFEMRYYTMVERAHGLPTGIRQLRRTGPGGTIYDDVLYPARRPDGRDTIVHLDGRIHEHQSRFRDAERDNAATLRGDDTFRFGWDDVTERSCDLAGFVITVLNRNGADVTPRPCGPGCRLEEQRAA